MALNEPFSATWRPQDDSLESILNRFVRCWLNGDRTMLPEFLAAARPGERDQILVELIHAEFELRLKAGEFARVEEYVARFPMLADQSDVLCSLVHLEYRQRRRMEPGLDGSQFLRRFPNLATELLRWATEDDSPITPIDCSPSRGVGKVAVAGYEILSELGRGGMGVVYKARQLRPERLVALKVMSDELAIEVERARFRGEAEAVARLQHPGIVQIFEVGECASGPFFSLELLTGGNLAQKLAATPQESRWAAGLVHQLALAMQAAHDAGVLHRDLKPANVLLTDDGQPKITDFGLAKRIDDDSAHTRTGQILGTPSYMAPEQAVGNVKEIGPAADVYGLGAILYECLTGRPPFKGATVFETLEQVISQDPVSVRLLQPSAPRDLETVCHKCLHKEPRKRYASGRDLAEDLRRFLAGEPVTARPVGAVEKAAKWVRRRPAAAALVGVSVAAALALLTGGLVYNYWLQLAYRQIEMTQKEVEQANREANEFREGSRQVYDSAKILQDAARKDRSSAEQALLESRQILYALQLREIRAAVDGGDHNQGLALLNDAERCPPNLRDFTWRYYHGWCKRDRLTLPVGRGWSLAVSPDGSILAVGTSHGLSLYELPSGRLRATLKADNSGSAIAFSPDAQTVAAIGDKVVTLWDLTTGQVKTALPNCAPTVRCLAFSPDGLTVVAGGGGLRGPGTLQRWDVRSGKELASLANPAAIIAVAYSADGRYLGTGTANGETWLWELSGSKEGRRLQAHKSDHVLGVAFSPDNKTLATACADGVVKLWDLADNKCVHTLQGFAAGANGVAFTPDGNVVAGYDNACVKIWDAVTGKERNTFRGHEKRVGRVACTKDGRTVVSRSDDGTVKLWNTDLACGPTTMPGARGHAQAVADVRTIAFVADNRLIQVWDGTAAKTRMLLPATARWTTAIACATQSKVLAGGDSTGMVWLRDLNGVEEPRLLPGHTREINALVFAPDGHTLASASKDHLVKLWNVRTGECKATLKRHAHEVRAVAFAPDGRELVSCGWDGTVRLWDLATGLERLSHTEFRGYLYAAAYHPGGKILATAGDFKVITLWDVETLKKRTELAGHTEPIRCLAYSPDGKTLASAGLDGTILLWDSATLKQVAALRGHQGPIAALSFTANGSGLVSCGADKTLKLWHTGPS